MKKKDENSNFSTQKEEAIFFVIATVLVFLPSVISYLLGNKALALKLFIGTILFFGITISIIVILLKKKK